MRMIYASRMKGTDIISCLRSKYIMQRKLYIILRQQYIIKSLPTAGFFYSRASSQTVFSGQSVVSKWVRMAREKYSSFSHRAGASA